MNREIAISTPDFYKSIRECWPQTYEVTRNQLLAVLEAIVSEIAVGSEGDLPILKVLDIGCGSYPVIRDSLAAYREKGCDIPFALDLYLLDMAQMNEEEAVTSGFPEEVNARVIREDFARFASHTNNHFYFITACNVLHELFLNSEYKPSDFLVKFFRTIAELLTARGVIFIVDPFYPEFLSSVEAWKVFDFLKHKVEHADPPAAFFHPAKVAEAARSQGFVLQGYSTRYEVLTDLDPPGLGRSSYWLTLQKFVTSE